MQHQVLCRKTPVYSRAAAICPQGRVLAVVSGPLLYFLCLFIPCLADVKP